MKPAFQRYSAQKLSKGDNIIEIDLSVLMRNTSIGSAYPDHFICECKTHKEFSEADIERMKLLSQDFPGSILVFATLNQKLSDKEVQLISQLAISFHKGIANRPINPVLILTGNELLNQLFFDKSIRHLYNDRLKFEDKIGHLCDVNNQHYLGIESYRDGVYKRIKDLRNDTTN